MYTPPLSRWSSFKATALSLTATLFPFLDVPVFWPILLIYFCVLVFVTMKRQIRHMIRYRYVPFSLGKKARRTRVSSARV